MELLRQTVNELQPGDQVLQIAPHDATHLVGSKTECRAKSSFHLCNVAGSERRGFLPIPEGVVGLGQQTLSRDDLQCVPPADLGSVHREIGAELHGRLRLGLVAEPPVQHDAGRPVLKEGLNHGPGGW